MVRRVVSVWLKQWPVARLLTQMREGGAEPTDPAPIDPAKPFVIEAEAPGGARIAALNGAAERAGLKVGGRPRHP